MVVRRERDGQVDYAKRKFGTTRKEIVRLAAWLQHEQAGEVVIESRPTTGVWRGTVGAAFLTASGASFRRARAVGASGITGMRNGWRPWPSGDLEESFIPGAEQRQWRWLTRSRVQLKRMIVVTRNQVEGLPEQGRIKMTSVAIDPFGVSGWAMLLRLIVKGRIDVEVLAAEARGGLRKKKAQLKEALAGKLDPAHPFLLTQRLEQVEL